MTDVPAVEDSALAVFCSDFQTIVNRAGECRAQSGCLDWEHGRLLIHSDRGPAEQEKDTNQDYVLAWRPCGKEGPNAIEWALVLADGVSSSFAAERAAQVACWASLATLVAGGRQPSGDERMRTAVDAAGEALARLAVPFYEDPAASRPSSEFPMTWEYILREGLLLQTTLTLAWSEAGILNLGVVGDCGGAIREMVSKGGEEDETIDVVLASVGVETNRVHALGPRNWKVSGFDVRRQRRLRRPFLFAVHTDGLARGGVTPTVLLDDLERMAGVGRANLAASVIAEYLRIYSGKFDDNLTLALVTGE